jgi:hypothetical protein
MRNDAKQRFLGKIVGFARTGQVSAEAPHVDLDGAHEGVQRLAVTGLRIGRETVQIDHPTILALNGGNFGHR